ncbi:MAG: hypothetical protein LLG06_12320 [Desulfobacteraceae bacterium]|nr:hypothetical protein [Desulfobacteraceae bacterium]
MKDLKTVSGNPRRKRLVRALTIMLVADLVIALAIICFLSPGDRKLADVFSSIPKDRTIVWGMGAAFAFVAIATFLAFRSSGKCPVEFGSFADSLGLAPIRRWGAEGGFGGISLFGIGPYYETSYSGHPLKYCPIVEDIFPRGGRLSLGHTRPAGVRFFGRYGLQTLFTEARNPREFKDLFAGKLQLEELGAMEVWAVEEEKAEMLFRDRNVTDAAAVLQAELGGAVDGAPDSSPQTGFVVNEHAVTVIFIGSVDITKGLVDAMAALSTALTSTPVSGESPRPGLLDRFYRPVVFALAALTVFVILAQLLEYVRR